MGQTKRASAAQALPYWTAVTVPVRQIGAGGVAVLVLKDGSLSIGFDVVGKDAYVADDEQLNATAQAFVLALRKMRPGTVFQAVFESGMRVDDVVRDFAKGGSPTSHPVLRYGRQARAAYLSQQDTELHCFELTYWLTWPYALNVIANKGLKIPIKQLVRRLKKGVQGLYDMCEACIGTLGTTGMRFAPLDEKTAIRRVHRAVNPSMHDTTTVPWDTETQDGPGISTQWGPSLSSRLAISDTEVSQTRMLTGYPPVMLRGLGVTVPPGFTTPKILHRIIFKDESDKRRAPNAWMVRPFRLVVTHRATDKFKVVEKLSKRRKFLWFARGEEHIDHEADDAHAQTDETLSKMQKQSAKRFDTSIVAVVQGTDAYELDRATQGLVEAFGDANVVAGPFVDNQHKAWQGALPGNGHVSVGWIPLLDANSAHFTPYWTPSAGTTSRDVLLKTREGSPFGYSMRLSRDQRDAGMLLAGRTGAGKTAFYCTLVKYSCLDFGGHAIIGDNKGRKKSSYAPWCKALGGTYVCFDDSPEASFNFYPAQTAVFDATGELRPEVLGTLEDILGMMAIPSVDENDREYFKDTTRQVVRATYEACRHLTRPVYLQDTIDCLHRLVLEGDKQQAYAKIMRDTLGFWLRDGQRRQLFGKPVKVELSNPLTVFDFYNMAADTRLAQVMFAAFSNLVAVKMQNLPPQTPKHVGLDEVWAFDNRSHFYGGLYRTLRASGGNIAVISQSHKDVSSNEGIKTNLRHVILLAHTDGHAAAAEAFKLNAREVAVFESIGLPINSSEMLFKDTTKPGSHILCYEMTPFDYWCDTSDPPDMVLRQKHMAQHGDDLVKVAKQLALQYPRGVCDPTAEVH